MRVRKIFCVVLAAAMMLASIVCSAAAEESANAKLAKLEIDTYGSEQMGALLDRISRLEKDYIGQNVVGNMNARIDAIWDNLYNSDSEPGILAKINVLEWNANHEVKGGGVANRITALEREILGNTTEGTFNDRIRALARGSYGEEILPLSLVQIPANTLIKVETTVPANSKTMQEGDSMPVRVVEDIFVDGSLVFARGLPGEGTVTRVLRAKNIFSNGKIETDFHTLKTIDGQEAKIFTGVESLDEMTAKEMGRGLSLVGQSFSGKTKDVEQVFIRGKNIDLPAGIELYVQIKTPILVYGVKSESKSTGTLSPDELETKSPGTSAGTLSPDEMNVTAPPRPAPTVDPDFPPPANNGEVIEIIDESDSQLPAPQPQQTSPPQSSTQQSAPPQPQQSAPAPTNTPDVQPRPDEGKTFDGGNGEIIEIIDEG